MVFYNSILKLYIIEEKLFVLISWNQWTIITIIIIIPVNKEIIMNNNYNNNEQ